MRMSIIVIIFLSTPNIALSQFDPLDRIARSLSDISNQMRSDGDKDRLLSLRADGYQSKADYYYNMSLALNQRLIFAMKNANDAVYGWRQAEQAKIRLLKSNEELEKEVRSMRAELTTLKKAAEESSRQKQIFEDFAKDTLESYKIGITKNQPQNITEHILRYWQTGEELPKQDPKLTLLIEKAPKATPYSATPLQGELNNP